MEKHMKLPHLIFFIGTTYFLAQPTEAMNPNDDQKPSTGRTQPHISTQPIYEPPRDLRPSPSQPMCSRPPDYSPISASDGKAELQKRFPDNYNKK